MFTVFDRSRSRLQKNKKYKLVIIGFQLIEIGWKITKGLDLGPSPSNQAKFILKNIANDYIDQFNKFHKQMIWESK